MTTATSAILSTRRRSDLYSMVRFSASSSGNDLAFGRALSESTVRFAAFGIDADEGGHVVLVRVRRQVGVARADLAVLRELQVAQKRDSRRRGIADEARRRRREMGIGRTCFVTWRVIGSMWLIW